MWWWDYFDGRNGKGEGRDCGGTLNFFFFFLLLSCGGTVLTEEGEGKDWVLCLLGFKGFMLREGMVGLF